MRRYRTSLSGKEEIVVQLDKHLTVHLTCQITSEGRDIIQKTRVQIFERRVRLPKQNNDGRYASRLVGHNNHYSIAAYSPIGAIA